MHLNEEKELHKLKKTTQYQQKKTTDFHATICKWLKKLSQRWPLMAKVTSQNWITWVFLEKDSRKGITIPHSKNIQKTKKQLYGILYS